MFSSKLLMTAAPFITAYDVRSTGKPNEVVLQFVRMYILTEIGPRYGSNRGNPGDTHKFTFNKGVSTDLRRSKRLRRVFQRI